MRNQTFANFLASAILIGIALPSIVYAQGSNADAQHQQLLQELGQETTSESGESVWKFGIRITANGDSRGITGTFPVPIEWPEQTVVEIEKGGTDNIARFSYKRLTKDVNQVLVRVNSLANGEVAEATVTFRIQKTPFEKPENFADFSIPKRLPSTLRKHLTPSPFIESKNRAVKAAAASIEFADDATDWSKVETIYKWVRENIQYEFDTQIHSCMDALESGHGDCEELSSLFIAICRIKGIPARAVWIPGHTYPEFYLVDTEGEGKWFPCQAAGSYAFGAMTEARPILQKGDKFKVPGTPDPTRYVQPTLVAKEVDAAPTLEWISEQIIERSGQ